MVEIVHHTIRFTYFGAPLCLHLPFVVTQSIIDSSAHGGDSSYNKSTYFIVSTKTSLVSCVNKGFSRPRHLQGKRCKLAFADKLRVFLSLTLFKKANFDLLQRVKYDGIENM